MGNRFFRSMIAMAIILLGVILVLENLGLAKWSIGDWWPFIYPTLIILVGLRWLYKSFKGLNGIWVPLFLITFGSLLLLDQFDYITFLFWDVYKLWPLVLVFIGLSYLGIPRKRRMKIFYEGNDPEINMNKDGERERVVFGDYDYSKTNWKVEPTNIWNFVGDHTMDFTKAFIPDNDTPITIHGLAGDINIVLPHHVDFSVRATVHAGEVHVLDQTSQGINRSLIYESEGYEEATRKLTFNLKLNAGSIRVDRI